MAQSDLQRLLEEGPDRSLDSLEADIWAGVEQHMHARHVYRTVFAAQAVVVAAALIGSAVVGFHSSPVSRPSGALDIFSPQSRLAVSTLLAGEKP